MADDSIPGFIRADWPAPPNVFAGCTTRLAGLSKSPFDSFNLATHVGDVPEHVEANRSLLIKRLRLPSAPAWLEQVHGNKVIMLDENGLTDNRADACVSTSAGQVCVVMTADCLPVLFCDKHGRYVAAAHAGWRGLAAGVLAKTTRNMPCDISDIHVWLGPAIGPANYEVDDVVRDTFLGTDPNFESVFFPRRAGHWTLDLYALARHQLRHLGITSVHGGRYCTFADAQLFFSYRREQKTGRMASIIWFEDPGA